MIFASTLSPLLPPQTNRLNRVSSKCVWVFPVPSTERSQSPVRALPPPSPCSAVAPFPFSYFLSSCRRASTPALVPLRPLSPFRAFRPLAPAPHPPPFAAPFLHVILRLYITTIWPHPFPCFALNLLPRSLRDTSLNDLPSLRTFFFPFHFFFPLSWVRFIPREFGFAPFFSPLFPFMPWWCRPSERRLCLSSRSFSPEKLRPRYL